MLAREGFSFGLHHEYSPLSFLPPVLCFHCHCQTEQIFGCLFPQRLSCGRTVPLIQQTLCNSVYVCPKGSDHIFLARAVVVRGKKRDALPQTPFFERTLIETDGASRPFIRVTLPLAGQFRVRKTSYVHADFGPLFLDEVTSKWRIHACSHHRWQKVAESIEDFIGVIHAGDFRGP